MAERFLNWLNSPESFDYLRHDCAKSVIRRAEKSGIVLDDSYLQDGEFKTYLDAVASGLWAFLKDEAENLSRKATPFLVSGDKIALARYISSAFIDACIDKRRNDSPFQAYYRHMGAVLRQADGINFHSIPRKCSYYAWSQAPELPLFDERLNYESWQASSIPFRDINKKDFMIALSRHYWEEALRVILAEHLFSIQGLVAFVASKYPLIMDIQYEPGVEDTEVTSHRKFGESLIDPEGLLADGQWARQFPIIPVHIVEVDLGRIARDCAAKLTKEEKVVVCGIDIATGDEIAKALGKKGPSNVDYYKKPALKKVREAWSLWGQPDSEFYAVEVEECRVFIKKLVGFCKEALACRDSGKEGSP